MLKIDVIKFEAQDVVTTSVAEITCCCSEDCYWDETGYSWHHIGCNNNCKAEEHPYGTRLS